MENVVNIRSTMKAIVSINVPSLNLRRSWAKKNAVQKIPFDILEQAFYEPGVEYLFRAGILYIDDMKVKQALGLEAPDTEVPTMIVDLSDEYCNKLLTGTALKDFREELEKLSHDQLIELAHFAVELGITDYHRCQLLKDKTGIEVLQASVARTEAKAEAEALK